MININISRKHILFLVFIVAVATFINYTIAQGGVQSHPISEVTDLDANVDGVVDLANNSNYLGGQLPAYYEGGGGAFETETKGASTCEVTCTDAGRSGCAFCYNYDGGPPANIVYILECAQYASCTHCVCWP